MLTRSSWPLNNLRPTITIFKSREPKNKNGRQGQVGHLFAFRKRGKDGVHWLSLPSWWNSPTWCKIVPFECAEIVIILLYHIDSHWVQGKIGNTLIQHVLCKQESGLAKILSRLPQYIFCRFKNQRMRRNMFPFNPQVLYFKNM